MQILPLKFIHDDDKKAVGVNLFNLAKLKHAGLPVVESVVVVPPIESIKKVLEKYSRLSPDLKNHLHNLKQAILRLKTPEALMEIYSGFPSENKKSSFNLNIDKLWANLLEKWLLELTSKIERSEKNLNFTPQQIVFSSNFKSLGSAFFDEDRNHVVVRIDDGELDFKKSEEIENLVQKANKSLFLPQVFYWVIEGGQVKLIKLAPFAQSLQPKDKNTPIPEIVSEKQIPKTATKILLNYSGEVLPSLSVETLLFRLKDPDVDKVWGQVDKILNLREATVIFYPDFPSSLDRNLEYAKSFLFFKNKKKIDCQIILPQTFSVEEFLNLKRQFASLGIYGKGSLKVWKQFLTIADFINVDQYLDGGFDGAAIDLDRIVELVTGVKVELFLSEPHIDWIKSVEEFLKDFGIRNLIKNQKPILVFGSSARNEELLNFFIKSGVWGIAFEKNLIDPLREHIAYLEKNVLKTNPRSN